jgi:hypothetical protein
LNFQFLEAGRGVKAKDRQATGRKTSAGLRVDGNVENLLGARAASCSLSLGSTAKPETALPGKHLH